MAYPDPPTTDDLARFTAEWEERVTAIEAHRAAFADSLKRSEARRIQRVLRIGRLSIVVTWRRKDACLIG